MKFLPAILISILMLGSLLGSSCSDTNVLQPGDDIEFPDSNVSFFYHVQPFLRLKCSYQGCHSEEHRAGGIRLTDYFSLFETPLLIVLTDPPDPDNSWLVQIIERRAGHNPYLPDNYITQNEIDGIRQWILEGARNN
ncbi:MAG: hypothetical protein ACLFQX_10585 [Candidatus Kapaibacterium sp.]